MTKIKAKFQAGVKGKSGINVNLVITGHSNLSTSSKTTRYVTTTGVHIQNLEEINSNLHLKSILTKVEKEFERAEVNATLSEITRESIRSIIDAEMQRDATKLKTKITDKTIKTFKGKNDVEYFAKFDSLIDCLNLYIDTKGGYLLGINNNDVKEGTLKNFRVLEMHLKASNKKTLLSDVDQNYIDKLEKHFIKIRQTKSNYIKNLKSFKRLLKFATHKKVELTNNFFFEEIKPDLTNIEEVQTENIFSLTKEDIKQLYFFEDFSKTSNPERAEIARDIFIFLCITGCRISDIKNAKRFNIEGVDQINYISDKTGAICNVPLNNTAQSIIMKYQDWTFRGINNELLPNIPDQEVNQYIKEVGKALEWFNEYPVYTMMAGDTKKQMNETKFKYNRLMTKVGRKTFATLLDDEGFEGPAQIMMGYKPKGMFHKHYSDKKKMMPKLLKAVKTLDIENK
jgi:integrase